MDCDPKRKPDLEKVQRKRRIVKENREDKESVMKQTDADYM